MNRSDITCYPQPGKQRSFDVLRAFAEGCRGKIADRSTLMPGAAAFYGLVGIEYLLRLAIADGRDYYYGDNAFFDCARGRYFRFAKNCIQLHTLARPDHDRLNKLGVSIAPWRRDGRYIVVVEQSEHFMELVGEKNWLLTVISKLEGYTDRPLRIRRWRRDKAQASTSLRSDLVGAWALVTHMSAAANEALLAGIPVFVSGRCAALPMASGELSRIDTPLYPDGREDWAAGLAGQQWTMDELRSGKAWGVLN